MTTDKRLDKLIAIVNDLIIMLDNGEKYNYRHWAEAALREIKNQMTPTPAPCNHPRTTTMRIDGALSYNPGTGRIDNKPCCPIYMCADCGEIGKRIDGSNTLTWWPDPVDPNAKAIEILEHLITDATGISPSTRAYLKNRRDTLRRDGLTPTTRGGDA